MRNRAHNERTNINSNDEITKTQYTKERNQTTKEKQQITKEKEKLKNKRTAKTKEKLRESKNGRKKAVQVFLTIPEDYDE